MPFNGLDTSAFFSPSSSEKQKKAIAADVLRYLTVRHNLVKLCGDKGFPNTASSSKRLCKRGYREIGRACPRVRLRTTDLPLGGEVRRQAASMFSFVPLINLSHDEKRTLKIYVARLVAANSRSLLEPMYRLALGQASLSNILVPVDDVRDVFKNPALSGRIRIIDGENDDYFISMGSRGLQAYLDENQIDLPAMIEHFKHYGPPLRVLDFGCCRGEMLYDLKTRFGSRVRTHGLSPHEVPHFPMDCLHLLTGEYLPQEFREKFNIIVSHRALEYALLPHLALRGLALALAPGGMADVQFMTARCDFGGKDLYPEIRDFYRKYTQCRITERTCEMLAGGQKLNSDQDFESRLIAVKRSIKALLTLGDGYKGCDDLHLWHASGWCNEAHLLSQDARFEVQINGMSYSGLGFYAPSRIKIKRKDTA